MKYPIYRAVVIGAGTMGASIAAHLANAGVPVTLLDIIPEKLLADEELKQLTITDRVVRNRIVQQGYDRVVKSRPASFVTQDHCSLVRLGNLDDDFSVIERADWIIEAIIENLQIKRNLMRRIDSVRKPESIVSTNTSGIPVSSIAEGCSESFQKHFLGTHFFNPPRYLKLLEIIPTQETLPGVVEAISQFSEYRLGKGIVLCKDTPNFIANRVFAGSAAFLLDYILRNGYTVEEVDAITGPVIGNPKTATFRLFDLIGIDVWEHVGNNLAPSIPHDEHALRYIKSEPVINLIHSMVSQGRLGTKVKQGFYKEVSKPDGQKEFWTLDLQTLEYQSPQKVRFESIGKCKDIEKLKDRLSLLMLAPDRAGELIRAYILQSLVYAAEMIPEIANTPGPIDDAMRWGFNREAGPFEMWDMLGVAETITAMHKAGFAVPIWVNEMLALGFNSFYKTTGAIKSGVYSPDEKNYIPIKKSSAYLSLKEQKESGKLVSQNPGASLIDLGDGILCVEFQTKMNTLDDDIFNLINEGMDHVEKGYEGLVIGNEGENFSAGANLMMVVMGAQSGLWDQLEAAVRKMQAMNMRMRYFPKPVIVAPAGLALGGGAEIMMYASRIVAHIELYTGLIEFGAGVIPAGGGTKEIIRRIINPPMLTPNAVVLPFLQRAFEQIGYAKVATSAEEARQFAFLGKDDRVVMNRDHLISEAKNEALYLASGRYKPPLPEKVYASGRDALAALRVAIYMLREGCYITEYEAHIAEKLAYVLTGGDLSSPSWVDEQYILDLEVEAFLSLCGEPKTQQRMWNLLQTGKPLRN